MDRGAWRATVHRVAKSQIGLKRLSMRTQQSAELTRQGELFRAKRKKKSHTCFPARKRERAEGLLMNSVLWYPFYR